MTLPPTFLARLQRIVSPEDYDRVLASFAEPRRVGFRVNTLLGDGPAVVVRELEDAGLHPEKVEGLPLAYTVSPEEREALLAAGACADGRIYVQDLASQYTVHVLDPQPGEKVLDLCAAPGSKTGQIAALMKGKGEIAAVEVSRPRFFRMRANLDRQGAAMVRTFHRDGATVWRHRPDHFDRVLVDAPCSTEGRFRLDDPESYRYWQPRKAREMARKQKRLIESAIRCLRPSGMLVYSTCTFAPEENEAVIDHAMDVFGGDIEIDTVHAPSFAATSPALAEWKGSVFRPEVERALRLLPGPLSEAFFVTRILRR